MNLIQKAMSWITQQLGDVTEWLIDHLGKLPTTNARIFVSLVGYALTVLVWLSLAILHSVFPKIGLWEPSWPMLTFMTAWVGIDTVAFGVKRTTDAEYVAAIKPPVVP